MYVTERKLCREASEAIALLPFALNWEKGPWVAGGLVRRSFAAEGFADADIDVFCASLAQTNYVCEALHHDGAHREKETPYSTFYKYRGLRVNVITSHTYATPAEVIEKFDMTLCQFVTDGDRIGTEAAAVCATEGKRIYFLNTDSVPATLRRAVKYGKLGYVVSDEEIGHLLQRYKDKPEFSHVREAVSG